MSVSNIKVLEKLLDFTVAKQKVISKNIANVGTLNYRREDIKFEDVLSQEISSNVKTTDPKHIPLKAADQSAGNMVNTKDNSDEKTSGFNNVDVNREMAEMAQNTLMFKFGAKKINGHFQTLQSVIRGGR
ncbi:MAG: flagellar basal body rod protein FlgB [Rhodothermaceae bacterium]